MTTLLLLLALVQQPAAAVRSTGTDVIGGVVTDLTGAPLAGVEVIVVSGTSRDVVRTATDGAWTASIPAGQTTASLHVELAGFAPVTRVVRLPASALRVELRPQAIAEKVTVTADTSVTRLSIDSSVTSIDRSNIASAPALRLDDQLRTVPGFSLFRRTSSAVANPTTQGVTLRGLSASGASRTLVVADDVPLNDPFGGWVYWDRIPMVALQRVDVVAEAWFDGGAQHTGRASGYGATTRGGWSGGAALEHATTDGFIVIAPEARGSIDVPADSRSTSVMAWGSAAAGSFEGTLRGGYFIERRGNGTPAQVNGTITRWSGANAHGLLGGGVWEARGDVSVNNYRQTFSTVATTRASERLTNLQWVGSTGAGGGLSWIRQTQRAQFLVSASSRIADANLDEASFSLTGVESSVTRTPARQHDEGVALQGRLDITPRLTIDAGARVESWRMTNPGGLGLVHKTVFIEPRVGASVDLGGGRTLRVDWLSGFRTPTINELFRSFRVGNTTTQSNPHLESEESWGPEAAFTMQRDRWTARVIGYATRLDGAIYNRTLSASSTAIVRVRNNGNARAFGSELELEWRTRLLALTSSWALNDSTFTSGELSGKRVPQVPRVGGTVGVRATAGRMHAAANVRVIGAQFDDDQNIFRLDAGSLVDGRVGWRWSRAELFGAIENALDAEIDTGKTPIRTVGSPRTARAGLTIRW